MTHEKLVRTRKGGWCDSEFAHPGEIRRGDVVIVQTHYPRSEAVRDFGVRPFTRTRRCAWCVSRDMLTPYTRERTDPALVRQWHELTGTPEPHVSGSDA